MRVRAGVRLGADNDGPWGFELAGIIWMARRGVAVFPGTASCQFYIRSSRLNGKPLVKTPEQWPGPVTGLS